MRQEAEVSVVFVSHPPPFWVKTPFDLFFLLPSPDYVFFPGLIRDK